MKHLVSDAKVRRFPYIQNPIVEVNHIPNVWYTNYLYYGISHLLESPYLCTQNKFKIRNQKSTL